MVGEDRMSGGLLSPVAGGSVMGIGAQLLITAAVAASPPPDPCPDPDNDPSGYFDCVTANTRAAAERAKQALRSPDPPAKFAPPPVPTPVPLPCSEGDPRPICATHFEVYVLSADRWTYEQEVSSPEEQAKIVHELLAWRRPMSGRWDQVLVVGAASQEGTPAREAKRSKMRALDLRRILLGMADFSAPPIALLDLGQHCCLRSVGQCGRGDTPEPAAQDATAYQRPRVVIATSGGPPLDRREAAAEFWHRWAEHGHDRSYFSATDFPDWRVAETTVVDAGEGFTEPERTVTRLTVPPCSAASSR